MRKHFLILMLLSLLPLAGWAQQAVDLSEDGWEIQFWNGGQDPIISAVYRDADDNVPQVKLYNANYKNHGAVTVEPGNFNVTWNPSPVKNVVLGGYEVTVTPDWTHTVGAANTSLTEKFYITKATSEVQNNSDQNNLQPGWTYSQEPNGKPALTSAVEVSFGTVEYSIDYNENTKQGTWYPTIPTIVSVGEYKVYYRVQDDVDGNYNGIPATKIEGNGTQTPTDKIVVAGEPINDGYTAPAYAENLKVSWNNGYEPKVLVSDPVWTNTVKGTFMYSYKKDGDQNWGAWTESKSTAAEAGTYFVRYMIKGAAGYYDTDPIEVVGQNGVTIAPMPAADYTVSNAQKVDENLVYNKKPQDPWQGLLKAAGSATKNASVKYNVQYSENGTDNWTDVPNQQGLTDYTAVKGGDAGYYKVTTFVANEGNYVGQAAANPIVVQIAKAQAYATAPAAIANVTWNTHDQKLIAASEGTASEAVEYMVNDNDAEPAANAAEWTDNINAGSLQRTAAATYYGWYQVRHKNYVTVPPTAIPNVKIAQANVSIIVNNASKKYDATGAIDNLTVVAPAAAKFTVTNAVADAPVSVQNLEYTGESTGGLGDNYKNADTYEGALTTTPEAVAAIQANAGYGTNYKYTIVPGNLIVEPCPIYVEAKANLHATFGEEYNISREYMIKGTVGATAVNLDAKAATAEQIAEYFTTAPVLTTDAPATLPAVKVYDLAFTAGTTAANYTMDLTKGDGENLNGYVIGNNKFTVENDPTHQLVITVLPQTQTYTGVAESWANPQVNVHYAVSGLIAGDTYTAPTIYRDDTNCNVGEYDLKAKDATVTNLEAHYPGGIAYNFSKFKITKAQLIATVDQQTIAKTNGVTGEDETTANGRLDQSAWTVEGLVNNEPKTVLNGELTVNNVGNTAGKTNISAPGFYENGIVLTITSQNYELKANTQYGTLRVINPATTIEFDPNNAELAELIEAKKYVEPSANTTYNVTFANKALKANTWYTMVLPFEVKTAELVATLKALDAATTAVPNPTTYHSVYAIVNRMNESTTADKINFTLEMMNIPANEPFLIKTAEDVNMQDVTFADKKIIFTDDPSIAYGGNEFIGTYTAVTNLPEIYNTTNKHYAFLATGHKGSKGQTLANTWWNANLAGLVINPMEGYLHYAYTATGAAPVITIEDFDFETGTTAIKTLNAETMKAYSVDGWYTLNGVKLQGVPTEKGVYINNGKKVVIK